MRYVLFFFTPMLLLVSCVSETPTSETLFNLLPSESGITFTNELSYTEDFNPYIYRNFYNGGGVAIGDINNDGLEDIYFTGNLVDNRLYLNKGNLTFEDISATAGVSCPNVWSTGATFVDVNSDGLLDLYVCKSGPPGGANRHNELFINNGDLTFKEASKEYGLDIEGLSVQAAFFDYDQDGDLDCYVLNNSIKSIGAFDLVKDQRLIPDPNGNGNKFLRNDGGKFMDVTEEAGIFTSSIGFGLGITLGDFNHDQWTDIYISNDFFERDYLYINNGEGGFDEQLESYFSSISMGAMGADFADLNGDGHGDLIVTEMLPETEERKKTKTVFETWDKQQVAKKQGYYNQFSRNTLQKNLGDGDFIEIGRLTDIASTEWSWSALLFDADNDGLRDIFISNGIYKDLLDRDYLTYEANDEVIRNRVNSDEKDVIKKLIDAMPSKSVSNAVFKNLGEFRFKKVNADWGLDQPSFSNGSVYTDLDNDGDLDLLVNNVNMPSFLYENTTDTLTNRSIQFRLSQPFHNLNAIGSKIKIKYSDAIVDYADNYNARGFQSSISTTVHFGVGNHKRVDSVWITWPDGTEQVVTDLATNKIHSIVKPSDSREYPTPKNKRHDNILEKTTAPFQYQHKENSFIDFNNERLLVQMYSNEGPAYARHDINEDGVDDFFLGGAKHQTGSLYVSSPKGYNELSMPFEKEKNSEDTDAIFFDGDGDGDMDLYVCHGGKAFSPYAVELHDSYYTNHNGVFTKAQNQPKFPRPMSSSVVSGADFDGDGDIDLFVGERFVTNTYGLPVSGYILVNNGKGSFSVTQPEALQNIGMITDASWADFNQDGKPELVVVGEWMPIAIYSYEDGVFVNATTDYGLTSTSGLWTSLFLDDVDQDGDIDIIAGNLGHNTFFENTMRMYVHDFDGNGFKEQLICKKKGNDYYPIVDKDELISQVPSLKKKLVYYKDYAVANMRSIFGGEAVQKAYHADIDQLSSMVFVNQKGSFEPFELPLEIQSAPIYAIEVADIDKDGKKDILFGGNQYMVKPKFGSYDGSRGWAILGGFSTTRKNEVKSLRIKGQIRSLDWLSNNTLIVTKNNEEVSFHSHAN